MNRDLLRHASDKVERALQDVHQIAGSHVEMLRICMTGAAVALGQAAALMQLEMERDGSAGKEKEATVLAFNLLRAMIVDHVDITELKLERTNQ